MSLRTVAAWSGAMLGGVALCVTLLSAACGLDLQGTQDLSFDAGDSAPIVPPPLSPNDAAAEAAIATCAPSRVVDDALTAIDKEVWLAFGSDGYAKVVDDAPGQMTPMVALLRPKDEDKRGGLWLKTPVPTRAFDVTLEYLIACEANTRCADGVAVSWIDTADPAVLEDGQSGSNLGVPPAPKGGAVSISLLKNLQSGQTDKPVTLAIHTLTDLFPGAISAQSVDDRHVNTVLTLTLSMRGGLVTASNGIASIVGSTTSGFTGYFGITAGTGSDWASIYVRSVRAKFYDCDKPTE